MDEISLIDLKVALNQDSYFDLIKTLLLSCTYPSKEEKVQDIINYYLHTDSTDLLGIEKNNELIGLLGIELMLNKGIIKHISILPDFQKEGIGTKVIKTLPIKYDLNIIEAETDNESVSFYQNLGFMTQLIENNSYSIPRYLCVLRA
ncbi:GNAT family N-acetyltransferase [Holosporaceae bacterium 'Namur']|nr:GNAT family N-acetyltransferase [Holosporaceae bacterium 'Namur']